MSKAFTSQETPNTSVVGRVVQPAARGAERPITPEGYRALVDELRRLTDEDRPRARAEPANVVREPRLATIEHRIAVVQATIASVRVVEPPTADEGMVRFGSTVTLAWENGRRQTLRLVGPDEVDVKAGRISIESPLARSLLGRTAGEKVELERPRGVEIARLITVV